MQMMPQTGFLFQFGAAETQTNNRAHRSLLLGHGKQVCEPENQDHKTTPDCFG